MNGSFAAPAASGAYQAARRGMRGQAPILELLDLAGMNLQPRKTLNLSRHLDLGHEQARSLANCRRHAPVPARRSRIEAHHQRPRREPTTRIQIGGNACGPTRGRRAVIELNLCLAADAQAGHGAVLAADRAAQEPPATLRRRLPSGPIYSRGPAQEAETGTKIQPEALPRVRHREQAEPDADVRGPRGIGGNRIVGARRVEIHIRLEPDMPTHVDGQEHTDVWNRDSDAHHRGGRPVLRRERQCKRSDGPEHDKWGGAHRTLPIGSESGCNRRLFSRANPSTIYARRQLQALVRRVHCEFCERSVLLPYLQQRNLVIDQDETVRDLNWATRELAAESCSHRHGGLVLDSVQRLYCILVLGLRVLLPGLYRVQTPNCATLIVHHRVRGKAIR